MAEADVVVVSATADGNRSGSSPITVMDGGKKEEDGFVNSLVTLDDTRAAVLCRNVKWAGYKKLPDGVELTLNELQDMASRQQQQIENQQQMLVAKEQRLKFLKQQELRHHQVASENERLRRLREKVEAQELKLRKLRALRGQVDQQKTNNNTLSSELESIRALFNEKEKELSLAVAKVDELTRQLEELRRGRLTNGTNANLPSHAELEKLRRELMYRNKLNEAQSAQLAQQREALSRGQEEMQRIDRRIAELQQRLHRKRLLNQQLSNQINTVASAKQTTQQQLPTPGSGGVGRTRPTTCRPLSANIAAVEPFKHTPKDSPQAAPPTSQQSVTTTTTTTTQDDLHAKLSVTKSTDELAEFQASKGDPKYQTLPTNTRFTAKTKNGGGDGDDGSAEELDKGLAVVHSTPAYTPPKGHATTPVQWTSGTSGKVNNLAPKPYGVSYGNAVLNATHSSLIPSRVTSSTVTSTAVAPKYVPPPTPIASVAFRGLPQTPLTAPTTPQKPTSTVSPTTHQHSSPKLVPRSNAIVSPARPSPIYQTSSTRVAPITPHTLSATPQGFLKEVEDAASQSSSSEPTSSPVISAVARISNLPTCQTATDNATLGDSGIHRGAGDAADVADSSSLVNKPVLPPKPSIPLKPTPPPRQIHSERVKVDTSPDAVDSALSILRGSQSPAKTTANMYRYGAVRNLIGDAYTKNVSNGSIGALLRGNSRSDTDVNTIQQDTHMVESSSGDDTDSKKPTELPIKAKPLTIKKNSQLDPPKLKVVGSSNGISSSSPKKPSPPLDTTTTTNNNDDNRSVHNVSVSINRRIEMPPAFLFPEKENSTRDIESPISDVKTDIPDNIKSPVKTDANKIRLATDTKDQVDNVTVIQIVDAERKVEGGKVATDANEECMDKNNKKNSSEMLHVNVSETTELHEESSLASSPEGSNDSQPLTISRLSLNKVYKGNLKSKEKQRIARRVSFDPLALLLDASLEGELELVKKTAREVPNPSAANDEGITALHNAICAGHYEIIKFLVQYGCDVNAQDSDGWTPLHCAASCNNLPMVKFLVEHGACIFATTLSDHETAAEKCEEDEEGFDGCSEYLYSIQEKLGILNNGEVYALYDYEAQNADELGFKDRDKMVVLRKGDEFEREWWWSSLDNKEGYIPRNLLGLYPRVIPNANRENS